MSQRIGIALLIALCSCSTNGPTVPPIAPADGAPTAPLPPAADTASLPPSAQLIPEPVDSVTDVPGTYVQPYALPGQVSVITIGPTIAGDGNYELYRSCGVPVCVAESGGYHIIPTNPAIGFAALSLFDQAGALRANYMLDYLWRDSDGTLVAIQLRALVGNGVGPTQVWWRYPGGSGATQPPQQPPAPTTLVAKPSLSGVYIRALPIYGDIGAITIDDGLWSDSLATGTYDASYPYCLPWCLDEAGDYELDVANPATGTAMLQLVPAGDPTATHHYVVYAIFRAPDGTPTAMQLQRVDGLVPSGPPFVMYRQWWTDTP